MNEPWMQQPTPVVDRLPLDDPDYRLDWPREVFTSELAAILNRPDGGGGMVAKLLLEEAFIGSAPAEAVGYGSTSDEGVLTELWRRRDELQVGRQVRAPYYLARTGSSVPVTAPDWDGARQRFPWLVKQLDERGYFDRAWGLNCVDRPRDQRRVTASIEDALGVPNIHPFGRTDDWPDELFLSVVEVLHDLVARPRNVFRDHDFMDCGRHYSEPAPVTGQEVYRFRVNTIFEQARLHYRLADAGEDYGRVVAYSDDAREALIRSIALTPPQGAEDEVLHAIALFRSRGANREIKRSAVVALARVLESHRALLKAELLSKDEGALFQIANTFDVRHSNESQLADYDGAFLDWIFWWYLATIELIRTLIRRP